jgi:hypothetical protein
MLLSEGPLVKLRHAPEEAAGTKKICDACAVSLKPCSQSLFLPFSKPFLSPGAPGELFKIAGATKNLW